MKCHVVYTDSTVRRSRGHIRFGRSEGTRHATWYVTMISAVNATLVRVIFFSFFAANYGYEYSKLDFSLITLLIAFHSDVRYNAAERHLQILYWKYHSWFLAAAYVFQKQYRVHQPIVLCGHRDAHMTTTWTHVKLICSSALCQVQSHRLNSWSTKTQLLRCILAWA
jgi:hypothetical protein